MDRALIYPVTPNDRIFLHDTKQKMTPKDSTDQHFYNVMPEVTSGAMVKAKVAPVLNSAPNIDTNQGLPPLASSGKAKSKILLFGILGLILLVIIGGAVAYFYTQNSTPEIQETNINTIDQQPESNPDVTTPADWQSRYFGTEICTELVICGDKADPDRDGLDNVTEYDKSTAPNNNDSDSDGVADGDEVNIFRMDPLLSRTYRSGTYTDSDFIKGGYDIVTDEPYTNEQLLDIKSRIKQFGLHQPTLTTLGPIAFQLYEFIDPTLPQLPANLDLSPQAKLDRDSQRQSTIKKVGVALIQYQTEKKSFPPTDDFIVMADLIKPYNLVATNYNDPISIIPYVYGYVSQNNNSEFTLSYYSETQNQLIKYTSANAATDAKKEIGQSNDTQRRSDLESLQQALLVYSSTQLEPGSEKQYVFPPADSLKTELARFISQIPVDPVTKLDYTYSVNSTFDGFSLKAIFENPKTGTTGYLCNQNECKEY